MGRQLDLYTHPQTSHRATYLHIIVVQHDSVTPKLSEVLAVPLSRPHRGGADRLMPLLDIDGNTMRLLTPLMRRVQIRSLPDPISNLGEQRDRIIAAIDLLFAGS